MFFVHFMEIIVCFLKAYVTFAVACSTTFIQQPSNGQTVDVANSVAFVWDPSCLNITGADIYLYAPLEATPLIQMFQNVDFVKGSFNVRPYILVLCAIYLFI